MSRRFSIGCLHSMLSDSSKVDLIVCFNFVRNDDSDVPFTFFVGFAVGEKKNIVKWPKTDVFFFFHK